MKLLAFALLGACATEPPPVSAVELLTDTADAAGVVLLPETNRCYPDGGGQVCCGDTTAAGYCCCQIAFGRAACSCVPPPTDPGHGGTATPFAPAEGL